MGDDGDGDTLSDVTWRKINDMFPRMKGELREQSVSAPPPRSQARAQVQVQGQEQAPASERVGFDPKEYPHPTPTPYSRMEEKLDIDDQYIRKASSSNSNTTLRSRNGIDASSVGSDEIVLVD